MPHLRRSAPAKLIPQLENAERRVLHFEPLDLAVAQKKPTTNAADFLFVSVSLRNRHNQDAVNVTAPVDASEMA